MLVTTGQYSVFPAYFQARVGQRLALWAALLLALVALFGLIDMIHDQKVELFLAQLRQAATAGATERLQELHGQFAYHAESNSRNKLLLSLLIVFLLVQIAALEFRWLVQPIANLTAELQDEKSGAPHTSGAALRRDEIGILARALQAHHAETTRKAVTAAGKVETLNNRLAGTEAFGRAAVQFREDIGRIADGLRSQGALLADASAGLSGISMELGETTRQTSQSIRDSSEKVDAAGDLVRNFATTIHMLSSEMENVSRASNQSRSVVDAAHGDMQELKEAVVLIGQMVTLISDVATRTNLLALNATIEAARAGELGRGFAVVAVEVKQLAQQTSQATTDASQRLAAVQAVAGRIAERMSHISTTVQSMDQDVQTITGALGQEGNTSLAVSSNARTIADAVRAEADKVARILDLVEASDRATGSIAATSQDLAGKADQLKQAFESFVQATAAHSSLENDTLGKAA